MDHVGVARRVPPTRYAQSAGAKIAFQVSGEGRCDLVFVPGLVSHLELQWQQLGYRRFVSALERVCRVIRFDKRGTGLSDPTAALPVPALVVHREQDMIPLADARAVADAIPGAVLRVDPGRDHLPWAGEWEPVVQAVADFIGDVAGPGSAPAKGPGAPPARAGRVGWPSLTEGEWRVAALAAQGHTNAEIADRLFLSRYTVETHLKHVFAKLGLRSRAELAAVAASGRPGPPDT